jgi:hypothetical protein
VAFATCKELLERVVIEIGVKKSRI